MYAKVYCPYLSTRWRCTCQFEDTFRRKDFKLVKFKKDGGSNNTEVAGLSTVSL